jgi:hypothetical protein
MFFWINCKEGGGKNSMSGRLVVVNDYFFMNGGRVIALVGLNSLSGQTFIFPETRSGSHARDPFQVVYIS